MSHWQALTRTRRSGSFGPTSQGRLHKHHSHSCRQGRLHKHHSCKQGRLHKHNSCRQGILSSKVFHLPGFGRVSQGDQPTRHYLLKLSVPGEHGPSHFLAFQPYFTKLFWARESTEYLVLTEILQQHNIEQAVLGYILPCSSPPLSVATPKEE